MPGAIKLDHFFHFSTRKLKARRQFWQPKTPQKNTSLKRDYKFPGTAAHSKPRGSPGVPFDGGCGSRRAKPYSSFALTFFPVLKGPEQRPTTGLSVALSVSDVRPRAEAESLEKHKLFDNKCC